MKSDVFSEVPEKLTSGSSADWSGGRRCSALHTGSTGRCLWWRPHAPSVGTAGPTRAESLVFRIAHWGKFWSCCDVQTSSSRGKGGSWVEELAGRIRGGGGHPGPQVPSRLGEDTQVHSAGSQRTDAAPGDVPEREPPPSCQVWCFAWHVSLFSRVLSPYHICLTF